MGVATGDGVAVSAGVGNSSKARTAKGRMPSTWAGWRSTLAAELAGRLGLAFADTFDLGRVQRVDLRSLWAISRRRLGTAAICVRREKAALSSG